MRLWIKNPLAILAENAGGGIVVSNKKIVALVKINEVPPHDQIFDASQHVVLFGAYKADRVMVGGFWRVTDGQPVGIDEARLRFEHGSAAAKFI
jgi:8-oxoguanine deaminase